MAEDDLFYSLVAKHFTEKKIPLDLLVASILLPQSHYPRSMGRAAEPQANDSIVPPYSFLSKEIKASPKKLPERQELLDAIDKIIEIVKTVPLTTQIMPRARGATGTASTGTASTRTSGALSDTWSGLFDAIGSFGGGQVGGASSADKKKCIETCEELKLQIEKLWLEEAIKYTQRNIVNSVLFSPPKQKPHLYKLIQNTTQVELEDCFYDVFYHFKSVFSGQELADTIRVDPATECSILTTFTLNNMWTCQPPKLETFRLLYINIPVKQNELVEQQKVLRKCALRKTEPTQDGYILLYFILKGKPVDIQLFPQVAKVDLKKLTIRTDDVPNLITFLEKLNVEKSVATLQFDQLMSLFERIDMVSIMNRLQSLQKQQQTLQQQQQQQSQQQTYRLIVDRIDTLIAKVYKEADVSKVQVTSLAYLIRLKGLSFCADKLWIGANNLHLEVVWPKIPNLVGRYDFFYAIKLLNAVYNDPSNKKIFELYQKVMKTDSKTLIPYLDRTYLSWEQVLVLVKIYIKAYPNEWTFIQGLGHFYNKMLMEMTEPSTQDRTIQTAFNRFLQLQKDKPTAEAYIASNLRK